ncbi:semaphorin-4A [Eudromia elegans]
MSMCAYVCKRAVLNGTAPGPAGRAARGPEPPAMGGGAALRLLCALLPAALLRAEPLPRVAFAAGDPRRPLGRFRAPNVSHYDALLLRADEERLYVGARDRLLALAVGGPGALRLEASIAWDPTAEKASECAFKKKSQETECFNFMRVLVALNQSHLYACGTYAFSPACAYVELQNFTLVPSGRGQPYLDGKGQCPFDPQHTHTALLADGELYAGTMNNFQGNEPIISRWLGGRPPLKTDAFLRWLAADAAFVASFSAPHDDKVYFFFEETAAEFDFFERLLVARVARVCKGDAGGDKVLQKKWTTFLKARLECARPGRPHFNVIRHASAAPPRAARADFYAVFSSQWQEGPEGSAAVCAYSQEAVDEVFEGKYKELNKESSRWSVYGGPDMSPRPGSCSVGPSSDKALTFLKEHFLMEGSVRPRGGRPLLVRPGVTYTRVAVDEPRGVAGGTYRVLFLGTANGFLDKAVELPGEPHIIESIQLFRAPEPVKSLLLAPNKGVLYVGYSGGLLQVPLANCSGYRSCAECLLARDPYCAWDSRNRSCRAARDAGAHASGWLQDVEAGQPAGACHRGRSGGAPHDDDAVTRPPGAPPPAALLPDHTLLVAARAGAAGSYRCRATENGYAWTVARYELREPARAPGGGGGGGGGSYWAPFVAVTALLAVAAAAAGCVALGAGLERIKGRRKVRGCATPAAAAAAPARPDKEPLRAQSPARPRGDGERAPA